MSKNETFTKKYDKSQFTLKELSWFHIYRSESPYKIPENPITNILLFSFKRPYLGPNIKNPRSKNNTENTDES